MKKFPPSFWISLAALLGSLIGFLLRGAFSAGCTTNQVSMLAAGQREVVLRVEKVESKVNTISEDVAFIKGFIQEREQHKVAIVGDRR